MKKRLVSLGLCALMLAPAATMLTSCGGSNPSSEVTVIPPITLTLDMVTDGRTTREGIQAVQDAINLITENALKIHVVLELYTEDTYLDAIKNKIVNRQAAIDDNKKYTSIGNDGDVRQIEIVPGQYRTVTAYPDTYEDQLDVFMVYGYDMLAEIGTLLETYVDGAYDPTGDMNDTAKLTKKYISDRLMGYGTYNDSQYVVPGNAYYGNYEYLLINKELFDSAPFAIGDIKGLADLGDYLAYIGGKNADLIPLYNVGSLGLVSIDGKDSVVSTYVPNGAQESDSGLQPKNIFGDKEVVSQFAAILAAGQSNGKYANSDKSIDPALLNDPDAKFAAAFIQGTADLPDDPEISEKYYVVKTRNPVADQNEIYASMFAVCGYSSDAVRCMELVNMLMTNEELVNTLLYGVENVTYTRDELTKIVERRYTADPASDTNAIYIMDENKIGNTFLAWQNSEMSEEMLKVSANEWELAKKASTDATFSPFARFIPEHSEKLLEYSKILSDRYEDVWAKLPEISYRINNATGELYTATEFCSYLSTWLGLQDEVNFMANASYTPKPTDEDQSLPYATQFHKWWQEKYSTAG